MSLAELRLHGLRCLQSVEVALHPGVNLITGANGAGKTSLLEAVYLLGRGRSFRTRITEKLIAHAGADFWIYGALADGLRLGFACSRAGGSEGRIDGRGVTSMVELSERFPVQVIDPGIHRLVEEGPAQRRRWLDWAVFHVEPQFLEQWIGYQKALRQRNAALKTGAPTAPWDVELIRLGELLAQARARMLSALQPFWHEIRDALGALPVELGLFQGWATDQSLTEALEGHLERDRERGSTLTGPHRFDVLLKLDGRGVRETVSRGQQKLLGVAMALAMVRFVSTAGGRQTTLLLDDPAAELDAEHTAALLRTVAGLEGQLLVTALSPELSLFSQPNRVFHVEHGKVRAV